MSDFSVNLWDTPAHALEYLAHQDAIPHRAEGEAALLEMLPATITRVLDLGSGDGRLLSLVKLARPGVAAVALDFSETMLERLRYQVPLPAWGAPKRRGRPPKRALQPAMAVAT